MAPATEESVSRNVPPLVDLPVDVIFQIADYLPMRAISHLASTCRDLKVVLVPELFRRDRTRKLFCSLHWATSRKKHPTSISTLEGALGYWPNGADDLQVYFKRSRAVDRRICLVLTPLLAAIEARHLDVVGFLLSKGVDVHQAEKAGKHHRPEAGGRDSLWYPLHHAVMLRNYSESQGPVEQWTKVAIIERLLQYGANPNQLSAQTGHRAGGMVTPLHLAIRNGANSEVIQLLIRWGAAATRKPYSTVPHQRLSKVSPISRLINEYPEHTKDHCASLKMLATNGGGSHDHEARKYTETGQPLLLEYLSRPKETEYAPRIVHILLKYTRVNAQHVSTSGDVALVHFLRRHFEWKPSTSRDPRYVTSNEVEHSMNSVAGISCNIIDELFHHGTNIKATGSADGETPLHIACGLHRNYRSIFEHLLELGARIDSKTSRGHTLLHSLVMGDTNADFTLMTVLIKKFKLKRYARDNDGNTFLHLLVTQRLVLYGKWMAQAAKHYKRADFDDPRNRNNAGRTPLEEASFGSEGNGTMTRFWLRHAFDEESDESVASRPRQSHTADGSHD